MDGLSAVIFIPDDTGKTGYSEPMMLKEVCGAPLLAWLSVELYDSGVGRFFLVCHDRYVEAAKACMPPESKVMTSAETGSADLLHVFLSTAEEGETEVTIVTGPAIYAPLVKKGGAKVSCVCRASRQALMEMLDESFSFSRFLRDDCDFFTDADGYYTVDCPAALYELSGLLREERMLRLQRQGVEIFDPRNCYVTPSVRLEPGARLLAGAEVRGSSLIRSEAVIGPWSVIEDSEIGEGTEVSASQIFSSQIGPECRIGPFAHIRPGTVLARGSRVGNFTEVKNSSVGEGTKIPHLSYVGDAEIGKNCNLGCGTVTVNYDRVEKHRTQVGDSAFVGCHTALVAPVSVGDGAYIAAGSVITENVPENALAIARSRQTSKKDWALRHKK